MVWHAIKQHGQLPLLRRELIARFAPLPRALLCFYAGFADQCRKHHPGAVIGAATAILW